MTRRTLFRVLVAITIVWVGWAVWSLIGRSEPYELRVLDDLGAPIADAVVDIDGAQAGATGVDGRVELVWDSSEEVLQVNAPGHVAKTVTLTERPESQFDVVLNARVLRGRVVDVDGEGIGGAIVDAGPAKAISDDGGYFQIRGAETGQIVVNRPAWLTTMFEWDGQTGESLVTLEPFNARAVHIDGAAMRDRFPEFLEMAETTELNALMIDLKDESGYVMYDTHVPTAIEVGADIAMYRLGETIAAADTADLYVIGRIVLFNDPIAAVGLPEMAVWDTELNQPYEANGQYFLDPTDPDARQYGLDLATEACRAGVDEIQFDYVRFPDARRESARFDGGVSPDVRVATISGFLTEAVAVLRPLGCAVAADIFGYLTTAPDDGGIGQQWEDIAQIVDVVSPMLYASHYHPQFFGFDSNELPGQVVQKALEDGFERLPTQVVVRPWLQDFGYDAEKVREQIEASESFGLGWMLWNAKSNISMDALQPAE